MVLFDNNSFKYCLASFSRLFWGLIFFFENNKLNKGASVDYEVKCTDKQSNITARRNKSTNLNLFKTLTCGLT